ncbi:hypothetical protein QQP08_009469 [Theobroma cacao]|nr:hypothetical protein QQP08_009469 [Theobroma cacao]
MIRFCKLCPMCIVVKKVVLRSNNGFLILQYFSSPYSSAESTTCQDIAYRTLYQLYLLTLEEKEVSEVR